MSKANHPASDPFDEEITLFWLQRTWSMVGIGVFALCLSCLFNPFGLLGILALTAALGGGCRALHPPPMIRPNLQKRHVFTGVMATCVAFGAVITTVPVVLSHFILKAQPPLLFGWYRLIEQSGLL